MKLKTVATIAALLCCNFLIVMPLSAQELVCSGILTDTLQYSGQEYRLSKNMQQQLIKLKEQMLANPDCKVVVSGNSGGSKFNSQLSWDRVATVIDQMADKNNIDRNRFIFIYDNEEGPENGVTYRAAQVGEDGPSYVAPPHEDIRRPAK